MLKQAIQACRMGDPRRALRIIRHDFYIPAWVPLASAVVLWTFGNWYITRYVLGR